MNPICGRIVAAAIGTLAARLARLSVSTAAGVARGNDAVGSYVWGVAGILVGAALYGGSVAAVQVQGMGADNSMRQMMRQMMPGIVPPPGMTPERLPDADSKGARLLVRFCGQCHDLPSPRYKTAAEWPEVFERMNARMRMMGGGMMAMRMIQAPDTAETQALLEYLQRHGMRGARLEELQGAAPEDRVVFEDVCSRCHALPSPSLHPANEWVGVVVRMQGNMHSMNKTELTALQLEAVVRVLQTTSGSQGR